MISTDYAPNESWDDAMLSLITLCLPWLYQNGNSVRKASDMLHGIFPGTAPALFLSGRGALASLLQALHLPEGSEIVVAGFTCEAVVLPILHMGLKAVYADIETDTFSLDALSLMRNLTARTKAIILQHSFGLVPKERDKVLQLAKEKNLIVIEDLAHGFEPGFWQKQRLTDKQVLLLSFGRSKALSSVFGGAVIAGDPRLEAEIKAVEARLPYPSLGFIAKLLCYKPISWLVKNTYNFFGFGKFIHYLGRKSGLLVAEISQKEKDGSYDGYLEKKYPNALAKLLVHQLGKYPAMVGKRAQAAALYRHKFPLHSLSVPSRFPILIEERDKTLNDVKKRSIYLGNWYTQPVAPAQLKLRAVGYTMNSCPVAERVCRRIANLPTLVEINEAERILEAVI